MFGLEYKGETYDGLNIVKTGHHNIIFRYNRPGFISIK